MLELIVDDTALEAAHAMPHMPYDPGDPASIAAAQADSMKSYLSHNARQSYIDWAVRFIVNELADFPENLDGQGRIEYNLLAEPFTVLNPSTVPPWPDFTPADPQQGMTDEEHGTYLAAVFSHEATLGGAVGALESLLDYSHLLTADNMPFTVLGWWQEVEVGAWFGVTYNRDTQQYERCITVLFS